MAENVPVEYSVVQSLSAVSTRLCWGSSMASSTTRGTWSSQLKIKSSVVYDTGTTERVGRVSDCALERQGWVQQYTVTSAA